MSGPAPAPRGSIRSYVVRNGRITAAQQRALVDCWPRYGLQPGSGPLVPAVVFGREAPSTLEIGFGNGEHLLARAIAEPGRDFIGVEVHRSGVGQLLLAAAKADIGNLRVICHDAIEVLATGLAPASLDEVQLLFPDPWPKARHNKRRIVQPSFLSLLARVLRPRGELHMATDWMPYAEHMREVLAADLRFEPADEPMESAQARAPTRFERRGLRLGHEIADLHYSFSS